MVKLTFLRLLIFLYDRSGLWKSRFFLKVAVLINNAIPKPDYLLINEQKLYIHKKSDSVSSRLFYKNVLDPLETHLTENLVLDGDTVCDVGAHIGYYTLILSDLVGKRGEVYAFEPDDKNFSLLQKNIKANKIKNAVTVKKAVSDVNKKILFYKSSENKGDNRIFPHDNDYVVAKKNSVTLDKYFFKKNIN